MTKFAVAPGILVDDSVLVATGTGYSAYAAAVQTASAAPAGTGSLTGVMMGLAQAFTPKLTGRAWIWLDANVHSDTAGDGVVIQVRYGTGGAPANGAAPVGTQVGINGIATQGPNIISLFTGGLVTGLAIGTTYWIDGVQVAVTGGNTVLPKVVLSVLEF